MAPFVEADVERLVRRVNSQPETNDQEWRTSAESLRSTVSTKNLDDVPAEAPQNPGVAAPTKSVSSAPLSQLDAKTLEPRFHWQPVGNSAAPFSLGPLTLLIARYCSKDASSLYFQYFRQQGVLKAVRLKVNI